MLQVVKFFILSLFINEYELYKINSRLHVKKPIYISPKSNGYRVFHLKK